MSDGTLPAAGSRPAPRAKASGAAARRAGAPRAGAWWTGAWGTALVPAVLALGLGLWGLRRQDSMWRDESVTYQVAHRGVGQIGQLVRHVDAVHGVYYLLMHGLFAVWDDGLLTLRLPSVVATAAAAALVALTGRRLAGRRAGLWSGVTFALVPLVQMYAQEGRSYALVCALVALATYLFVRALGDGGGWRLWAGYGAAIAAAGWLHEFAVLALAAHGVTVLVSGVGRAARVGWAVAAVGAALSVAPLAVFSTGQSAQVAWLGGPGLVQCLEIAAVVALGAACAWVPGPAGRRAGAPWGAGPVTAARLGLPLLVVPTALLLAAGAYKPMYLDRYVLYSYLGLGLLMGRALDALFAHARGRAWRRRGAWCGVVLAVLALVPVSLEMRTPDSRKDDVTAVSLAVRRLAPGAGDVLFMPSRRREWRMSYPGPYLGLHDLALRRDAVRSHTLEGEEEPAPVVRERVLGARRIVALTDPQGQPLDTTAAEVVKREVLRRHFVRCDRIRVKGAQVVLYAHRGDCPDRSDRSYRPGRRTGRQQLSSARPR